jgi:hypothetical protein
MAAVTDASAITQSNTCIQFHTRLMTSLPMQSSSHEIAMLRNPALIFVLNAQIQFLLSFLNSSSDMHVLGDSVMQ